MHHEAMPRGLPERFVGDQRSPEGELVMSVAPEQVFERGQRLLPSIGPTFVTASAPAALARSRALRKLCRPRRSG